jgi:hypothetical protein
MKNLTIKLAMTGIAALIGSQAITGGSHFHATCAFESCKNLKSDDELKGALPKAVELLKLSPTWSEANIEGELSLYKKAKGSKEGVDHLRDVVQFKANNAKTSETKLFSFTKGGVLLGAKTVK